MSSFGSSKSSRKSGPQLLQAIRRIDQVFASNLYRAALLDLALKTAVDAARARRLAVPGVLCVARRGNAFADDEHQLLRALAAAGLGLESSSCTTKRGRHAVTDELTALANYLVQVGEPPTSSTGRWPCSGHSPRLAGDSPEADSPPARQRGDGVDPAFHRFRCRYTIAERGRTAIETLEVLRVDDLGTLGATASLGVAASIESDKNARIGDAEAALYKAEHSGKNRTMEAQVRSANAVSAE